MGTAKAHAPRTWPAGFRAESAVWLDREPLESLVVCLTQVSCRVLAASPLARSASHDELVRIRIAVRDALWETLAVVTEEAGAGRTARFGGPDGGEVEWTAVVAWRVASALAERVGDPEVFAYLAEELPQELAEHVGVGERAAGPGSLAACRRVLACCGESAGECGN